MTALLAMLFSHTVCAANFQTTDPPRLLPPLVYEDANGVQHSLADERGHYLLLNIWASWCAPCVGEMPSLDALQKKFDVKKLRILPLSEDRTDGAVSVFYKTHHLSLSTAIDHAGMAPSVLHLQGLPTTLLIDPQGREVARLEGDADWSAAPMLQELQARLAAH